jgi:F-type H+-transporting ATPase subunit b
MARREARFYGEESRKALKESLQRRVRQAEEKIARAEETAIQEIRSKSADVAVAAAETIIARELKGKSAGDLVTKGIREVSAKLN